MSENLKTFRGTVGSPIIIKAKDHEEAEAKYDAYFWDMPCPCKSEKCDCVYYDDDTVNHTLEEVPNS